jgi:iron complex outermembrane recepter protein
MSHPTPPRRGRAPVMTSSQWRVHSAALNLLFVGTLFAQQVTSQSTKPSADEVLSLSPFEVSAQGDRGYGVTNSIGASRINLPLEDISTAVATLNRSFMDDVGAVNLVEAIKYVTGVDMAAPLAEQWSIRGTGTNLSMLDGVPDPGGSRERYDPWLTERIEVLKGPVGTLYGSHAAGGLINRVSKFPLPVRRAELALSAGSWGLMRVEADATGPVTKDNRLRYRLTGGWRDGEYDFENSTYRTKSISPVVSYVLNSRSKVWVRGVYRFEQRPTEGNQNYFLDADNNVSYFISPKASLDNPDSTFRTWFRSFEGGYDNAFETGRVSWATRVIFRQSNADSDSIQYTKPQFRFINAAGAVIGTQANTLFSNPNWVTIDFNRGRRERNTTNETHVYNADLSARFELGAVEQWALTYFQGGGGDSTAFEKIANYAPSNIHRPVQFANGPDGIIGPFSTSTNTQGENEWYAWGVHDNIFMFKRRVIFAGGARFDHQETESLNRQNNVTTQATNEEWSYKFGVIGKPLKGTALFYNWAQTFTPENRIDTTTGQTFPNQISTINEGGLKVDLFSTRLTGTFTVFDLIQDSVVVNVHDPLTGIQTLKPLGSRIIRGWEGDFDGQPINNVFLKVGIGKIDKAANENGQRPRWVGIGLNYKFFGKYTFNQGPLKGLSAGGGVVYTNDSAGDNTDTFTLPGHAEWEALVQYSRKNWSVQLNVRNLTDERYAITAVDRTRVYSGEPRNYSITWRYRL